MIAGSTLCVSWTWPFALEADAVISVTPYQGLSCDVIIMQLEAAILTSLDEISCYASTYLFDSDLQGGLSPC